MFVSRGRDVVQNTDRLTSKGAVDLIGPRSRREVRLRVRKISQRQKGVMVITITSAQVPYAGHRGGRHWNLDFNKMVHYVKGGLFPLRGLVVVDYKGRVSPNQRRGLTLRLGEWLTQNHLTVY